MSGTVFAAVILAALLHASWNALVKGGLDTAVSVTAVILGHVPLALVVIPFVPIPAAASWPYLAAGLCLHIGYQVFLQGAYRAGDLTQVYPIARGSAPLIVAGFSVLVLGVHLQSLELIAIVVIASGIMSLSLVRQRDGLHNRRAAGIALVTGCFIAGYSLVDGTGARLAGTALGFYSWLSITNAIVFTAFMAARRRRIVSLVLSQARWTFLIGGTASFVAYTLVIWAFTQAPIALVTALRETSIVFALLIGVVLLKERLDLAKVISTMLTLLGAGLLRLARH